jgi:hypothetical protein
MDNRGQDKKPAVAQSKSRRAKYSSYRTQNHRALNKAKRKERHLKRLEFFDYRHFNSSRTCLHRDSWKPVGAVLRYVRRHQSEYTNAELIQAGVI